MTTLQVISLVMSYPVSGLACMLVTLRISNKLQQLDWFLFTLGVLAGPYCVGVPAAEAFDRIMYWAIDVPSFMELLNKKVW